MSCFQTIEPNWWFSQTTLTIAVPSRVAVSSSWQFMRKPPSPLTVTTLRSGCTSLAAIAHGSAKPMPARPLAISTVLGSWAGNIRADPQLVQADVGDQHVLSGRSAWRISHSARGGCIGKCVVVPGRLEAPEHDVAQPRRPAGVRDVAALLGQPA